MRHTLSLLTAAVALALAQAASAATTTTIRTAPGGSGVPSVSRSAPFVRSAINTPANRTATTPATITVTNPTSEPRKVENTTNVDVRNRQTLAATAGTHSSGSTSSLGPLATAGATPLTGSTSGEGATGTGSSTDNGTGTGTGNGNGTGATTGNSSTNSPTVPFTTVVGSPFIVNPSDATTGGFASTTTTTASLASNGTAGSADVYAAPLLASNGIVVTEAQLNARVNASNVDRAIAQVERDRKRVGRNGQLLYSIAPRTNVDRSAEMPDDGPSPALSGFNSTLVR